MFGIIYPGWHEIDIDNLFKTNIEYMDVNSLILSRDQFGCLFVTMHVSFSCRIHR